ncbi:uncharacterized protein LOC106153089 isoform X1 [Lingula anatina]|uniref:Uncharacterized protein LOC106153089 isoform X1 n=1 Tax=Lingula anatina TaxID=7574 RepID=A0A1S3H896_LINAN|nr:uncharacterized protein LOC106153089 isoform X1 [Lingula anatina]|eukprot:XP_013382340.1 uncharacterized protein LOC106153089 isoform X1 [Lingula anatina]
MLSPESEDLELVYHEEEPDVSDLSYHGHALDTSTDVNSVNPTLQKVRNHETHTDVNSNGAILKTTDTTIQPLQHSSPVKPRSSESGEKARETSGEDVQTRPDGRKVIPASPELSVVAVSFSSEGEEQVTMSNEVVQTQTDGRKVIRTTPGLTDDLRLELQERPLKQRDMKFLRMFAIVSIFLFAPTGIAAFIYARKTKQEFDAGIERGNLDLARKLCKRTERLIMLSIVLSLFTAVLAFSLAENAVTRETGSFQDRYLSYSRLP